MKKNLLVILSFLLVVSYIPDLQAIERVSVASDGTQANHSSYSASNSADGRYTVFASGATNLVEDDTNSVNDIFVRDSQSGVTKRVSVTGNGGQANGWSSSPTISGDGRFIVFYSVATNLVQGDTNDEADIFIHDSLIGETKRITGSNGEQANGWSSSPIISADGQYIAFTSWADNLVTSDQNSERDVFVYNRLSGKIELVSKSSSGIHGNNYSGVHSISTDGRFVTFESTSDNLFQGDVSAYYHPDIFIHDRSNGETELISVSRFGGLAVGPANAQLSVSSSRVSTDGRYVTYTSNAINLIDQVLPDRLNLFVRDRRTNRTEFLTIGMRSKSSGDGRFVLFNSDATNLVDNDTNEERDLFVIDRDTGLTERINVSESGVQANDNAFNEFSISENGRFVVFDSAASNLVEKDSNASTDVFSVDIKGRFFAFENKINASVVPSSRVVEVGKKSRFFANLINSSGEELSNCRILLKTNPFSDTLNSKVFGFYTWSPDLQNAGANPVFNLSVNQRLRLNLILTARESFSGEVYFDYLCNGNKTVIPIHFQNTVFIKAKDTALLAEDYVRLKNKNGKRNLALNKSGSYYTVYVVDVKNTGDNLALVSLKPSAPNLNLDPSKPYQGISVKFCEPLNILGPTCAGQPLTDELQLTIPSGKTQKVKVFIHANDPIDRIPARNRVIIEARDQSDEVIAKNSIGVYTVD